MIFRAMALQTLVKRMQTFIESGRIVPERRVSDIQVNLRIRHGRLVLIDDGRLHNCIQCAIKEDYR